MEYLYLDDDDLNPADIFNSIDKRQEREQKNKNERLFSRANFFARRKGDSAATVATSYENQCNEKKVVVFKLI
jgi:hypothetical protein